MNAVALLPPNSRPDDLFRRNRRQRQNIAALLLTWGYALRRRGQAAHKNALNSRRAATGENVTAGRQILCVLTAEQSGLPMCSIQCLTYLIQTKKPYSLRFGITKANRPDCSHCYMCGQLTYRPKPCTFHGDDCPEKWFEMSVRGEQIIEALAVMTGEQLTDADIAYCQAMSMAYTDLMPVEVAQRIIDRQRRSS